MKHRAPAALLTISFYAFYDLHHPVYHAYAAARLPPEEARISVCHLFSLVARDWATIVTAPRPSAWAWGHLTRTVARRSGRGVLTPAEDAALLHDDLQLSIDKIATVTGADTAAVTALLAAARRARRVGC
ncbi:hypothetical protein [Streptomyces sp. NPDC002640]